MHAIKYYLIFVLWLIKIMGKTFLCNVGKINMFKANGNIKESNEKLAII